MNKSEWIAEKLTGRIQRGEWAVGEKIPSEAQLCEEYQTSRLTVRSALTIMSTNGYVQTYKGKGTIVQELPQKQPVPLNRTEIFEFRRILETEIARLAAIRADEAAIQKLKDLCLKMKNGKTNDEIAYYDSEFHSCLAQATKNAVIMRAFDSFKDIFTSMFEQNVGVLGSSGYLGHLKIVSAIEMRDSDRAYQYMYEHLCTTMEQTTMLNFL